MAINANATTYYVRDGGGTATQCSGTTNAVYPGSGTNQACAYNHPVWVTGGGFSGSGTAAKWVGGDTMSISGDSDTSPGSQAQYMIGYGMPNTSGCSTSWAYNCGLNELPAGTDASHQTTIIGTGTHQPQLWGTQREYQVLAMHNNYLKLQNIEITDHSTCTYNDPVNACNYGGSYPYGTWAPNGIDMAGTGITLTNVYIHGMGIYGIVTEAMGSATFTNVKVIGNGWGGFIVGNDGSSAVSGTLTFNQPIVEWNGCQEAYPLSGGIDLQTNYSNCFAQNNGGYGDGLAFGATTNQNPGNWTIIGPGSISWNTSDGLDTLHGIASGNTIQIDKMRFEGNAGNQVKVTASIGKLTNSIIVGNCGWWYGATQSAAGAMPYGDACRALGDVIIFATGSGINDYIYNNTIYSNGNVTLESGTSSTCDSTTHIYVYNNIIQGGYAWIDDSSFVGGGGNAQTTYIYNTGSDGNGAGSCGSLAWTEDYNIVIGTKNSNSGCNGAHDKCGTSPGFVSSLPMGTAGGAANTYYQAWSGITYAPITSGSAAKAAGTTGLTFWNNSNDYYNLSRGSPPSIGGLEYQSCAAATYGCFFNTDCCGGSCTSNVCAGSCSSIGCACSVNSDCTSNICLSGFCASYNCGDGVINSPEVCDTTGPNLNNQTCVTQGYAGGSLGCNSGCLSFNTSGCFNLSGNYSTTLGGKCLLGGNSKF